MSYASRSGTDGGKPSPSGGGGGLVDPREYIRVMEEKNKILKRLNQKAQQRQKEMEEREKGFSTFFAGAHSEKTRRRSSAHPSTTHSPSAPSSGGSLSSRSSSTGARSRRRTWSNAAKKKEILKGLSAKHRRDMKIRQPITGSSTDSPSNDPKSYSEQKRYSTSDMEPIHRTRGAGSSTMNRSHSQTNVHRSHAYSDDEDSDYDEEEEIPNSPRHSDSHGQGEIREENHNGNNDNDTGKPVVVREKRKNWMKNSFVLMTKDGKGIHVGSSSKGPRHMADVLEQGHEKGEEQDQEVRTDSRPINEPVETNNNNNNNDDDDDDDEREEDMNYEEDGFEPFSEVEEEDSRHQEEDVVLSGLPYDHIQVHPSTRDSKAGGGGVDEQGQDVDVINIRRSHIELVQNVLSAAKNTTNTAAVSLEGEEKEVVEAEEEGVEEEEEEEVVAQVLQALELENKESTKGEYSKRLSTDTLDHTTNTLSSNNNSSSNRNSNSSNCSSGSFVVTIPKGSKPQNTPGTTNRGLRRKANFKEGAGLVVLPPQPVHTEDNPSRGDTSHNSSHSNEEEQEQEQEHEQEQEQEQEQERGKRERVDVPVPSPIIAISPVITSSNPKRTVRHPQGPPLSQRFAFDHEKPKARSIQVQQANKNLSSKISINVDADVDPSAPSPLASPSMRQLLSKVESLGKSQREYLVNVLNQLGDGSNDDLSDDVMQSLQRIRSPKTTTHHQTDPKPEEGMTSEEKDHETSGSGVAIAETDQHSRLSQRISVHRRKRNSGRSQIPCLASRNKAPKIPSPSSLHIANSNSNDEREDSTPHASTPRSSSSGIETDTGMDEEADDSSAVEPFVRGEEQLRVISNKAGHHPSPSHQNRNRNRNPLPSKQHPVPDPDEYHDSSSDGRDRDSETDEADYDRKGASDFVSEEHARSTSGTHSDRQNTNHRRKQSIEESLNSLEFFEHTHKGRLGSSDVIPVTSGTTFSPRPPPRNPQSNTSAHRQRDSIFPIRRSSTFSVQLASPSLTTRSPIATSKTTSTLHLPSLSARSTSRHKLRRMRATSREASEHGQGGPNQPTTIHRSTSQDANMNLSNTYTHISTQSASHIPEYSRAPPSAPESSSSTSSTSTSSSPASSVPSSPRPEYPPAAQVPPPFIQRSASLPTLQENVGRNHKDNVRDRHEKLQHLTRRMGVRPQKPNQPIQSHMKTRGNNRSSSEQRTQSREALRSEDGPNPYRKDVKIPILPQGTELVLDIQNTWGDIYYVGLCGIECFNADGKLIAISDPTTQVTADPSSVNVLYEKEMQAYMEEEEEEEEEEVEEDEHGDGDGHGHKGVNEHGKRIGKRHGNIDGTDTKSKRSGRKMHAKSRMYDPRVPANLVDGVNCTCDDLHMWLAPYTSGQPHKVTICFDQPETLAMIRIWNYNKNRIHSFRGVQDVDIYLDSNLIFSGSIHRAPGNIRDSLSKAEVILFTTDEDLLSVLETASAESIANSAINGAPSDLHGVSPDQITESDDLRSSYEIAQILESERPLTGESLVRPSTGTHNLRHPNDLDHNREKESQSDTDSDTGTNERITREQQEKEEEREGRTRRRNEPAEEEYDDQSEGEDQEDMSPALIPRFSVEGKYIKILIQSTWGDHDFVGLTGIQVLNQDEQVIPLTEENISAFPRDINDVPGHSGDTRTLDKLLDGCNVTMNDNHMWLAPFQPPQQWMQLSLPHRCAISGLRIWNYNKNLYDTYRGIKCIEVYVDNIQVSPPGGFFVRKAPGTALFDFGQTLSFPNPLTASTSAASSSRHAANHPHRLGKIHKSISSPSSLSSLYSYPSGAVPLFHEPDNHRQEFSLMNLRSSGLQAPVDEYILPSLPCGFILKIIIYSTWGDPFYVGLNGIEIIDGANQKIDIEQQASFCAVPSSITEIPPMRNDVRTLDKLFDGVNNTWDDHHMWLCPLLRFPPNANTIYICFNEPISVSVMKFWNYSKTPDRGCRDIQIFLDDHLVFDGILKKSPDYNIDQYHVAQTPPRFCQSVLFTQNQPIVEREKRNAYRWSDHEVQEDIRFINNRRIVKNHKDKQKKEYPTCRPTTSMTYKHT